MSDSSRPQIRAQLTEHGRLLLIVCGIVAVIGLATGASAATQRILYPLLMLLLGTRLLGLRNLRGLRVAMPGPLTDFEFQNTKVDLNLRLESPHAAHDLLIHHGEGVVRRPVMYVSSMVRGQALREAVSMRLPARGRQKRHVLSVRSSWPLGLIRFEAVYSLETEILALPRLGELRNPETLLPSSGPRTALDPVLVGEAEEFYAMREWRPGMSQRSIHWKASARAGRLMLRETRSQRRPTIHIVLAPPTPDAGGTRGSEASRARRALRGWENSIRLTATLVEHFLRNDYAVSLRWHGESPIQLRVPPGRNGLFRALGLLAPLTRTPIPAAVGSIYAPRGDVSMIVQAGGGHQLREGRSRLDPLASECTRLFRLERLIAPRTRMEVSA